MALVTRTLKRMEPSLALLVTPVLCLFLPDKGPLPSFRFVPPGLPTRQSSCQWPRNRPQRAILTDVSILVMHLEERGGSPKELWARMQKRRDTAGICKPWWEQDSRIGFLQRSNQTSFPALTTFKSILIREKKKNYIYWQWKRLETDQVFL